jgi:hypothetical protein
VSGFREPASSKVLTASWRVVRRGYRRLDAETPAAAGFREVSIVFTYDVFA